MLELNLPLLDDLQKLEEGIDLVEYHLYSSIFEFTPKLFFELKAPAVTPDALGLHLGSGFQMKYQVKDLSVETKGVGDTSNITVDEQLPGMFVNKLNVQPTVTGTALRVFCENDFLATQNTKTRKAYVTRYGKEVVEDIVNSNITLKNYEASIEETDNVATVYRALGESDIEILKDKVCNHFRISEGKPLFYLGLDGKVHFTSINKLSANTEKAQIIIRAGGIDSVATSKTKERLLENYADLETASDLIAESWEMNIGGNSMFNLRTATYYTNFLPGITNTVGYIHKPANEKKTHYPIDSVFMEFFDTEQAIQLYNRPNLNICYEAANMFGSYEDLISIKVRIADCNNLNKLIVAGEQVTFLSPYTYSIYNGNYTVAEVEYGKKSTTAFIEMTLIRPNADLEWASKLNTDKDGPNFPHRAAAAVKASELYSV